MDEQTTDPSATPPRGPADTAYLRRVGRALIKVVVAMLAAWAGLVAAFLGLHAWSPERLPVIDLVVPDAILGWRHGSHLDVLFYDEGRVARLQTDAGGFRNAPPAVVSPGLTIAVLGDSFAFSAHVDVKYSFPAVVGAELSACRDSATAVSNYGVAGYGTVQQLLLYREVVAPTRPDIVLVAFFGNDVDDNRPPEAGQSRSALAGALRPWAELRDGGRLVLHKAGPGETARVPRTVRHVFGSARLAADRLWWMGGLPDPGPVSLDPVGWRAALDSADRAEDLGSSDAPGWATTATVLELLLREIAAAGAEAVLVQVGHPAAVEAGMRHPFIRGAALAAVARDAGARFIALENAFGIYRAVTGRPLHNNGGRGHWNEEGHRLAAALISRSLCGRDGF